MLENPRPRDTERKAIFGENLRENGKESHLVPCAGYRQVLLSKLYLGRLLKADDVVIPSGMVCRSCWFLSCQACHVKAVNKHEFPTYLPTQPF